MKKKLFGSLLCISLACITLIGARYQENPPNQTVNHLKISGAGVLQSLHDQSDREVLGGANAMREGYVFRYQTKQGERLIYAVGNQMSGLTEQDTTPAMGERATAIAKTSDGVLEISSGYKLDVENNALSIIRRIRNISSESVTLSLAQNYVDPRLYLGPQGFPPTPNQILDEFLNKNMGTIFFPQFQCSTVPGNDTTPNLDCSSPPPCTLCFPPMQLGPSCDLCQQVDGPGAEPCCAIGSLEGIQPQARIYSAIVGQEAYYDTAMNFLPENGVLTLHPPSQSTEASNKSRAYLIIQIRLPATFNNV